MITLSFDVEEFDFPAERGKTIDTETQIAVSTDGLESVLELLARHGVPATFYTTANYARHRPDVVRKIVSDGHEIASHDFYHTPAGSLRPAAAKEELERISGAEVAGYRSPRLADISSQELAKAGYVYNSSLNPTWIPGRYNNLRKPRTVFKDRYIINYPASVSYPLRIPLFWLMFHVAGFRLYYALAESALAKDECLNLYFHPWEFSDSLSDEHFGVPGYIKRCSGSKLLDKLDRLILRLKEQGYGFYTTTDFLDIR